MNQNINEAGKVLRNGDIVVVRRPYGLIADCGDTAVVVDAPESMLGHQGSKVLVTARGYVVVEAGDVECTGKSLADATFASCNAARVSGALQQALTDGKLPENRLADPLDVHDRLDELESKSTLTDNERAELARLMAQAEDTALPYSADGKLPEFDVQFEDVGFTSSDLSGRELSESEAQGFTATAIKERTLPDGVVAVVKGYITEDDNQDGDEKKVFACVTLRIRAEDEQAAEAFSPPEVLLAKLADMMGTDVEGNLDLHLEGNWEASVGSAEAVDPASAGAAGESPYTVELCIRAAQAHGEDSDPDHEVGDLQDCLREMWKLLTPAQRETFMSSNPVIERLELGLSSEEFVALYEDVEEQQPSTLSP